jgi:hypothetical protein
MRPLCYFLHDHWDNNKQQISWVIAPWWFFVSLWRICITFIWPRSSLKLKAPSSQLECHLHFLSIRLCLALLFIISIILYVLLRSPFKKANFHALVFWRICTIIRQSNYIQNTLVLLKMSKIPRVQIKDDLMLTAKPISRLLMIGLTICRAVSCERGEIKPQWVQIFFDTVNSHFHTHKKIHSSIKLNYCS